MRHEARRREADQKDREGKQMKETEVESRQYKNAEKSKTILGKSDKENKRRDR